MVISQQRNRMDLIYHNNVACFVGCNINYKMYYLRIFVCISYFLLYEILFIYVCMDPPPPFLLGGGGGTASYVD